MSMSNVDPNFVYGSELWIKKVLFISVNQKCGSAVLFKLSIRNINQRYGSKVLLRKVDQKKYVLFGSVIQKCGSKVLIR